MKKLAIIGAGFVGRAIAEVFIKAGYDVMISNSRGAASLSSIVSGIPQCKAGDISEAIAFSDVILIAIPFTQVSTLPVAALAGKIIIDANNYYPQRDGHILELDNRQTTTSQIVARHLPEARVIKAFNAILAVDVVEHAGQTPPLRALPVAGDDTEAKQRVMMMQRDAGFEAVDAGSLSESWRFERAKPCYCIPMDKDTLISALAAAQRDVEAEDGSWRQR